MLNVILVEPENSGNIGATARVMKNFGFTELILVNPKARLDDEAFSRAMHAKDVLESCRIVNSLQELEFDVLVATSSHAGHDYHIARTAITAEELGKKIDLNQNVGIVFGRESKGLTIDEILTCDFLVTIPASPVYPVLNLSHAVAIILYEIFKNNTSWSPTGYREATKKEKEGLFQEIEKICQLLGLQEHRRRFTLQIFKKVLNRAFISGREAYTLRGFLRRVREALERYD